MKFYEFDVTCLFDFRMCGKFEAVSEDWRHLHRSLNEFEYMLVTDGILYLADESSEYEVHSGEYLLMAPTMHQFGYRSSQCSFYWMHFSYNHGQNNPLLHTLQTPSDRLEFTHCTNHILLPVQEKLPARDRLIALLKQLQDSDLRYHEENLNRGLVLSILAETANQSSLFDQLRTTRPGEQLYRSICAYIQLHVNEMITVPSIAQNFGYSQKYLTAFFHRFEGCSIKQYLLRSKMEAAKAELADSSLTVSQIAYQLGYEDVHNFSNAFKKIIGISPLAYRQIVSLGDVNH